MLEIALLDTGARWSVVGGWTAELLADQIDDLGESLDIGTRLGRFTGRLCRMAVTLIADPDCGVDLPVDATVLVIADWPGPTVLGYDGLLERVRIALDPGTDGRSMFLFGPCD